MANKIAFITGASAGIGEATAKVLAENGFDLILAARRKDRLDKLCSSLSISFGIKAVPCVFDIRNKQGLSDAVDQLPAWCKDVDVLVNNAGLASGLATIDQGLTEDWETMIDTNIKGLLYITRKLSPGMLQRGKGHIVNIASIAGKEVYANGNVYCATKFAVDALNKGMRIEFSGASVKVTGIYPGAAETEFSLVRFHGDAERAKKVYEGFDALMAQDIADAILYAVTRPTHVNINEMIIMPTAQPMPGIIHRKTG